MSVHRFLVWLAVWSVCLAGAVGHCQDTNAAWLAEHYTKYEHLIPMRDGARLFTRVYLPKDDSQAWPILLTRTPYALKPYGDDNYSDAGGSFATFARDKFILVTQDVRGRYGSEGQYEHVRPFNPHKGPKEIDESTDAFDTIEWLINNVPNNNGKVGMFGISYPGFYTSMGMINSHPALKAASPQAPISDWFIGDDLHHNGAWFLSQNFGFFYQFAQHPDDPLHDPGKGFSFRTPDGYDFFLRMGSLGNSDRLMKGESPAWTEFLRHSTYDGFWQARNIRPHLKDIHCAVMTVGGWFDAEDLFGALETYRWTERQNPGITNVLVMGPWSHGAWGRGIGDRLGDIDFHSKTSEYYREKIELPFFRHFLKSDTNYTVAEAQVFETGVDVWHRYDAWPPKAAVPRNLYLQAGGSIGFDPPTDPAGSYDEFLSDPAKPVPFTMETSTDYPRSYMLEDQRFAAERPDVLVYQTALLEDDLRIAGPVTVGLQVSTTGTDSDWIVKLVDVYAWDSPDPTPNPAHVRMGNYQQLVRGDVFRGKFRQSFEKPEAFQPGKPTAIQFTMADVAHTFRRGHRVMVQIQCSWFPLVDRNPQTFVDISTAKPEDFHKATQRVYRGADAPSSLSVLVVPSGAR